jgi:hypothetical protein
MKRIDLFRGVFALLMASMIISPINLNAQEEEKSSPFDVGGDLVSSYLWRGTKFGTGPAVQPYLSFAVGGFTIGGWGSYSFGASSFAEADIYLSYGFDFGLSIGVTDYYFPGTKYGDYSVETGAHAFEINLGYEIKGFAISANYILNEAGGAGSSGGDMYFEAGYSFSYFGVHVGAGDGWHTSTGNFEVTNIGLTAAKDIAITDKFSLPVSGALIWNPQREQYHVVVGISF